MSGGPQRRLLIGAGAFAAAAGLGWAWWRARPDAGAELSALWALELQRPEGGVLRLAEHRGHPLVLNFWATWCPPCVREMPTLDGFHREWSPRGWRVVGIAVDQGAAVREFLARHPVGFDVGLAGFEAVEWTRRLGNPGGALPFTVVIDASGRIAHRHAGEATRADLERWAAGLPKS